MKYISKIFFFVIFVLSLFGSIKAQTNSNKLIAILQELEKKPVSYDLLINKLQTFQKSLPEKTPNAQKLGNQARFWEYELTYRKLLSYTHSASTVKGYEDLYNNFRSLLGSPGVNQELHVWIEYKLGFCQFRLAELARDIDHSVIHYKIALKHFKNIRQKENELYFPAQFMQGICFIRKALLEEYSYQNDQIKRAKSDLTQAEKIFKNLQSQKPDVPFYSVVNNLLVSNTFYKEGRVSLLLNDKKSAKIFWNTSIDFYRKILQDKNLSQNEIKRIDYLMKLARLNLYSFDLRLGDFGAAIHDYQTLLNQTYIPNFGPEAEYRNRIDLPFVLSISYAVNSGRFSSFAGDYVESSFWRGLYSFINGNKNNAESDFNQFLKSNFRDIRRNILLNLSHYYLGMLYFNENRFQDAIGQLNDISGESIKSIVSSNDILALLITSEIIRTHNQSYWIDIFIKKTGNLNNQDKTTLLLKIIHNILTKYSLTNDSRYYNQLNSIIQQLHNNQAFGFLHAKAVNAVDYLLALGSVIRMTSFINIPGYLQQAESAYNNAIKKLSAIKTSDKYLLGEITYLRAYADYRMAQTYDLNQNDSYKKFINQAITDFIKAYNINHNYRVLTRLGSLLMDPSLFPEHQFRKQALICFKHVYNFFEQNPQFDRADYFFDVAETNLGSAKIKANSFEINYEGSKYSLKIGNLDYKNSIPVVAGERISYDQIIDKHVRGKRKKQMALRIWQLYALPGLNIYPSVHRIDSRFIRSFHTTIRLGGFINEFHSLKVKLPVQVFYDTRELGNLRIELDATATLKNISYPIKFNQETKRGKTIFAAETPEFTSGEKIRLEIGARKNRIFYPIFKWITVGFFPDTLKFELSRKIEFVLQQTKQKNLKIDFDKLREKKYNQLRGCLKDINKINDSLSYDIRPFMGESLKNSIYFNLSKYPVEDTSHVVPVDILCDGKNHIYLLDWKRSKVIVGDKSGKFVKEFGRFSGDDENQIGQEIKLTYPLRFEILEPDEQHNYKTTLLLIADYYGVKICDLDGNYLGQILKTDDPKYNSLFPSGSIGRIISKGYGVTTVLYLLNRLNQSVYQFKAKEQK